MDVRPELLNVIGSALNFVGVLIVFKFGWPQPDLSNEDKLLLSGDANDPANATKRANYRRLSLTGLSFLTVGFALQFIAAWKQL